MPLARRVKAVVRVAKIKGPFSSAGTVRARAVQYSADCVRVAQGGVCAKAL